MSIHLDCSHFNRLTVAGLLFTRTLQAPSFKAPQDLDTRLAPLPCVRWHLHRRRRAKPNHLIPRELPFSRGTSSIKTHTSFEGLNPLYPCVSPLLRLHCSPTSTPIDKDLCSPISTSFAPPQPLSRLLSSHLFRVLARTSIVEERLFASPH